MSLPKCGIEIRVKETEGIARKHWPLTRGVPLPEGLVKGVVGLWVEDREGEVKAAQFRVLGRWPQGSVKWVLVDFQGDVEARGESIYLLKYGEEEAASQRQALEVKVEIVEREDRVEVSSGVMRFGIGKEAFALFDGVELGEQQQDIFVAKTEVMARGGGDAWAKISESEFSGETTRRIYGVGGECLASAGGEEYEVEV